MVFDRVSDRDLGKEVVLVSPREIKAGGWRGEIWPREFSACRALMKAYAVGVSQFGGTA